MVTLSVAGPIGVAGGTGKELELTKNLTTLGKQGVLSIDPLTGTPRSLLRLDGTLAGPAAGTPRAVALAGLRRRCRTHTRNRLTVEGCADHDAKILEWL